MDRLRALEYFVAAAQEGSLSAAARRLDVSVPAVSKMVAALEQHLGSALFDRKRRGLALTAEGARYYESCQPVLEMLQDAQEAIVAGAARSMRPLRSPPFARSRCSMRAIRPRSRGSS